MTPPELRARRAGLGLSQVQLARALGTTKNTVARWERGELGIRHPAQLHLALLTLERRQARRR